MIINVIIVIKKIIVIITVNHEIIAFPIIANVWLANELLILSLII